MANSYNLKRLVVEISCKSRELIVCVVFEIVSTIMCVRVQEGNGKHLSRNIRSFSSLGYFNENILNYYFLTIITY